MVQYPSAPIALLVAHSDITRKRCESHSNSSFLVGGKFFSESEEIVHRAIERRREFRNDLAG